METNSDLILNALKYLWFFYFTGTIVNAFGCFLTDWIIRIKYHCAENFYTSGNKIFFESLFQLFFAGYPTQAYLLILGSWYKTTEIPKAILTALYLDLNEKNDS